MKLHRNAVFLLSLLLVSGVSLVVWRHGFYLGDDKHTLFPVARQSFSDAVVFFLRPLEYHLVLLANAVDLRLWLPASLAFGAWAAVMQLLTLESVFGTRLPQPLRVLLVAGSPLWFQLLSQVDTVSQTICNAVFATGVYLLFTRVFPKDTKRPDLYGGLVVCLAGLLLFSKELALAGACTLVLAASALLLWRRQAGRYWLASLLCFAACAGGWVYLKLSYKSLLPSSDGHYNYALSVGKLAINGVTLIGFPLTPLPSSWLSFAGLKFVWMAAAVAFVLLLVVQVARAGAVRNRAFLALALVLAMTSAPMIIVHSSELYASMLAGYLVGALVFASAPAFPVLARVYLVLLLACSYVNAFTYYRAPDDVPGLGRFERVRYSLYNGPDGLYMDGVARPRHCPLRGTVAVAWECGKVVCVGPQGKAPPPAVCPAAAPAPEDEAARPQE